MCRQFELSLVYFRIERLRVKLARKLNSASTANYLLYCSCCSKFEYIRVLCFSGRRLHHFGVWKIETRNVLWLVTWEIHDFFSPWIEMNKKKGWRSVGMWMGCARENNLTSHGHGTASFAGSNIIIILSSDVSKLLPARHCVDFVFTILHSHREWHLFALILSFTCVTVCWLWSR